jgi:hypothetical protein
MRIGVLSNPTSHTNKAAMPEIRALLRDRPDVLHREIAAMTDVVPLLHEWAEQNLDLVVVNGGDGTVQAVMTDILNHDPFGRPVPLAIMPGGKTNMFALDLGCRGKPVHVLQQLLAAADAGTIAARTVDRPLVGLRRVPGEPVTYGTFFGTAVVVRGVQYCREHIYPLGLPNFISHVVAYTMLIGGSLTRNHGPDSPFRADDISITLDGDQRLSGRYFMIIVTSLDRLILGMRPFGAHGEGRLNFLCVDHSPGVILGVSARALLTRPKSFSARGTTTRRIRNAKLMLDCPVILDGEFFHPDPNQPLELIGDRSLPFVELK